MQLVALGHAFDSVDFLALDFDSEIDCAVLGDGCFKTSWDVEDHMVRIASPDMTGIFVWLYPHDHTRYWRLAHRYTIDPMAIRQQEMFYPQILQTNMRNPSITEVWTADRWETWYNMELVEDRPNPYGFIPYVVYPNMRRPKQFWGESDITNIREPCVELALEGHTGQLALHVRDDGKGFDAESSQEQTVGLGLIGINERAALVGGRAKVVSSPNKGTTIETRLPLTPCGEHASLGRTR